jgi:tetratricopeptide (TPR) repeat protein
VTLGATHIRPDGDARSGIEVLEKARALLPARIDIAGNLVYLYLRTGDLARAQGMTDQVIAPGGDAVALRMARAAIDAYKTDVAARRDLERHRPTPAEEARRRAYLLQLADQMRKRLESTTDPEQRAQAEATLAAAERSLRSDGPSPIDTYNEAIALANVRDYAKAIAMLEALQAQDLGPDMVDQVTTTLARLRQDAARYQQGAP